jgi:hypothetical protein
MPVEYVELLRRQTTTIARRGVPLDVPERPHAWNHR